MRVTLDILPSHSMGRDSQSSRTGFLVQRDEPSLVPFRFGLTVSPQALPSREPRGRFSVLLVSATWFSLPHHLTWFSSDGNGKRDVEWFPRSCFYPRERLTAEPLNTLALSICYPIDRDRHKNKPTTVRLETQDREAIEHIKELYGCPS